MSSRHEDEGIAGGPVPAVAVSLPYWRRRPPGEAFEVAAVAERLGFAEIWVGETNIYDAFALGAAIVTRTPEPKVVVGPLAVGVRSPALLAMGAGALSALGGRPAGIALGTSSPVIVNGWHGTPRAAPLTIVEETIGCLRGILAGERSNIDGRAVHSVGFRLRGPAAGTTVEIAAAAPKMLELAGRLADGVVMNMVSPGQVRALGAQAGLLPRDSVVRAGPRIAVWVQAALDPSPEDRAAFKEDLAIYVGAPGYAERFAELGFGSVIEHHRSGAGLAEVARQIPDDLLEAIGAVGDSRSVRSRIDEYRSAGADTVVVQPVTYGDPGGERLLGAIAAEAGRWAI